MTYREAGGFSVRGSAVVRIWQLGDRVVVTTIHDGASRPAPIVRFPAAGERRGFRLERIRSEGTLTAGGTATLSPVFDSDARDHSYDCGHYVPGRVTLTFAMERLLYEQPFTSERCQRAIVSGTLTRESG